MRNYVQRGETVTLTAPAALVSGQGFLVGAIFAVATADAASGAEVEGLTVGVVDLPKATIEAIGQGARVYWDAGEGEVTADDNEGANIAIGAAVQAAGNPSASLRVRLNGSF